MFLTQMRDVKTRRSIGVQMYCYLVHVRPVLKRESEIKEWKEVKKDVLRLLQSTPRGDAFCSAIVKHVDREVVWEDWKESKFPPMVPKEPTPVHEVVEVSLASRRPGDVRNLCRDDTLKDFVSIEREMLTCRSKAVAKKRSRESSLRTLHIQKSLRTAQRKRWAQPRLQK